MTTGSSFKRLIPPYLAGCQGLGPMPFGPKKKEVGRQPGFAGEPGGH